MNRDSSGRTGRLIVTGIIMAVTVGLFLIRLMELQIVSGETYAEQARSISRRDSSIPAPRGRILDRSGTVVARDETRFAVDLALDSRRPNDARETVGQIAALLGDSTEGVTARLDEALARRASIVNLYEALTWMSIVPIAEHLEELPGVSWREVFVRSYPYNDLFAHVVGYVGQIGVFELQTLYNSGYRPHERIGKDGVERSYDEELRGMAGSESRVADALGRSVEAGSTINEEPLPGSDVVLTIDSRIQRLVRDALGDRIGAAVVLRPDSGEILGMVSHPSYDPNRFAGKGDGRYFTDVSLEQSGSFINRARGATASPASTFKVVMTTAIIEEEAFPVDRTISDPGYYRVGDRIFLDHKEYGHGEVDLFRALAESCNTYYYTMGNEYLGISTIARYARDFGLGERTGVDLPGERSGFVPSPEWKLRALNDAWRPGDTVNTSIGQGYLQVTPLQMASAVSQIVNGGVAYRPHVVREIRDGTTGGVVRRMEAEVIRQSPVSAQTYAAVREAMEGVVRNGTPSVVMTTPVQMGGKTGTTQTGQEDALHSWFIGFANESGESFVTAVWIDAANEWDWWAPYATNIIVHGVANGLDYEQTIAELRSLRDPWLWYGRGLPE